MNDNVQYLLDEPFVQLVHNAKLMGLHKSKKFLLFLIKEGRLQLAVRQSQAEEAIDQILKIIAIFEKCYGENADFYLERENGGTYSPKMRVLYPEFTITNSNRQSHVIRDLLVIYPIKISSTNEVCFDSVRGARLSKTYLEILASYQQSHLSSHSYWNEKPYVTSTFCLGGTTDISFMVSEMSMSIDLDKLEFFLYCIDGMIKWESIEGVPYRYIHTIANADSLVINSFSDRVGEEMINEVMKNKIPLDVDFYVSEGRYRIKPNRKASDFFKVIAKNRFSFDRLKNILVTPCPTVPNTYLGMKVGSNPTAQLKMVDSTSYTIFRGRKIYPRILKTNTKETKEVPMEDYIIYPKLLEYVCRELEYKIYYKAIASSAAAGKATSSNANRGTSRDTILV